VRLLRGRVAQKNIFWGEIQVFMVEILHFADGFPPSKRFIHTSEAAKNTSLTIQTLYFA